MTKEKVRAIMDGEGDADGTYLSAKEAVKAGILPADHVIKTSKQVVEKVKNQIEGITSVASIRDIMASAIQDEVDENKLIEEVVSIHKQKNPNSNSTTVEQEQNTMKEQENIQFGAVTAQLGFSGEVQLQSVTARIAELQNSEKDLKEVKATLDDLKIKFKGKEAEVKNIQEELNTAKASLKKYQDAEEAAKAAEINALVDAAINAGKIEASAKEDWVNMANSNLEMVKKTLDSIPGRDNIPEEIANDPENKKDAQASLDEAQAKMAEQVKAVVGDITLKKF